MIIFKPFFSARPPIEHQGHFAGSEQRLGFVDGTNSSKWTGKQLNDNY